MLNKFSSGFRKLNRNGSVVNTSKNANTDLTGSLLSISMPNTHKFLSGGKHLNGNRSIINTTNFVNTDITSSLSEITIPTSKKYEFNRRLVSALPIINNRPTLLNFNDEILAYSAKYVYRVVDEFDITANTLIVKNVMLDYGTEQVSSENFEVFANGLQIPGNFGVEQIGSNIIITLYAEYIDFTVTPPDAIYVFGKIVESPLAAEISYDMIINTENDEDLIL